MINILIKHCLKCDDYTEMIINNKIIKEGDYYHDKINDYIKGFIEGLEYCGNEVTRRREEFICRYCQDDE